MTPDDPHGVAPAGRNGHKDIRRPVHAPMNAAQTASDLDQTTSDRDQTISDLDQTCSDVDQSTSGRDQLASDRDQRTADLDQAASDLARDGRPDEATYRNSRRARIATTLERSLTTDSRRHTVEVRDATAERRDLAANGRDAAARDRDRLADACDAELERWERTRGVGQSGTTGAEVVARAAYDRRRAVEDRARAAEHRQDAAKDREEAYQDRWNAAADRQAAAEELATAGVDELTSTLTRRVGLPALQREIDRVRRTSDQLVLAFVDLDGLKEVNDQQGHLEGDRVLKRVAEIIKADLRPYDLIVRFGGDEFLCALTGATPDAVRRRFGLVASQVAERTGTAISIGYAECSPQDSLETLVDRADSALIAGRREGA